MNIYGKKVMLRAVEKDDNAFLVEMLNDPELENLIVGWYLPQSCYAQYRWYEEEHLDDKNLRFIIETPEEGLIGMTNLLNIDWKNRNAFQGLKIANVSNRHKGYGTDCVMALMRYAFDELQLHRLNTNWLDNNIASMNMYRKLGWRKEGVQKQFIFKRGEFRDLIIGGILESEYREIVKRTHYWDA